MIKEEEVVDFISLVVVLLLFILSFSYITMPSKPIISRLPRSFLVGLSISMIIFGFQTVSISGALSALIGIGSIHLFLEWGGVVIALLFFSLATFATQHRPWDKNIRHHGARGAKHAIANCLVPGYLAFMAFSSTQPELFTLAYVASFAAATADTISGELGQVYGRKTIMITTLKPTRPGMNGGVTLEGTILGIISAFIIGLTASIFSLIPLSKVWIVVIAGGIVGNFTDSILGAVFENRKIITNEHVNFACTLVSALTAMWLA